MDAPRPVSPADATSNVVDIPLDVIFDGDRLRDLDTAWVATFAAEFEAGGEPPPIVVRRPEPQEGLTHEFALVAGGHRVAAFRQIGRLSIRAEIRPLTRLQARKVEIEENLFRHELTPLDRAFFIAELQHVWTALHPEATHGGDRKSERRKIKSQGLRLDPKRFTSEAAERCGLSERTVQASLALVAALSPEAVKLLRGTSVARNASELKRIADEPAERQLVIARLLSDGTADSVAKAKLAAGVAPAGEGDPQEELFRRILANWERLDAKGRKRFLDFAGLTERKPRDRMPKVSEIVPERSIPLPDELVGPITEILGRHK